jgi:hypothetical protein
MVAANEAMHDGYGGISRISRACGLSRGTITKAIRELGEDPIAAGPDSAAWWRTPHAPGA